MLAARIAALALLPLLSAPSHAQSAADIAGVREANDAYYRALSARDLQAMEQIWSRTPVDTNIAPPFRPVVHVGWDAVRRQYETFWPTLAELTVTMEQPTIHIEGNVAWVHGIESARRRTRSGEVGEGRNLGTSVFVRRGDAWRMVFHQAAAIPP